MKRFLISILGLTLCLSQLAAQPPFPPRTPASEPKDAQEDTAAVVPAKEGLFGVANKEDDWYFEIPDDLLGKRILAVTRFVTNTVGSGEYGGEEVNEAMVYWEKAPNGNLLLRADVLGIKAQDDDIIARAVAASSENPIIASFKPEKGGSYGTRIKVNSLFEDDVQVFSLSAMSKRQYNLAALKRDATFLTSIRTYPINTEVTVTKTYAYNAQAPGAPGAGGPPSGGPMANMLPAGMATGSVTLQLNTSFLLLPEEPMQPRMFDPRVGYFADGYTKFADDQQSVEELRFICRWRLEAKPEDVERQKRGELVEPVKPIVYYIDPATPKQWRKYLIAGVNDWQAAFEKAGWKNAIHAEEWPEDNPDMSLEDARFAVIRYLASDVQNAYGPNVHDPRSGEILESHIGWYHNVMSLVHDWYQIQAGAVDPRARSIKFDEELMGDLIRFVSSHEVGHTLGLRHNMGSSSQTPVEKLRDKEWLKENGHTISRMDYARFNYVAQPEDGIDKDGLYPRIGEYDKWAIEYGYKPTYIDDVKEDHLYWNKVIIERLAANPRLWFGGEGRDDDPRAQTEDLSDDAVKASEYGIMNLKRVITQIPEWNKEEADMYKNVQRMYEGVLSQFGRYMGHVARNIGGRYITNKSIEQEGLKYEPVPRAKQKEALNFLNEQLFKKPAWLTDVPYIYNIADQPDNYLNNQMNNIVSTSMLLSNARLTRMAQFSKDFPDTYSPQEYISDLSGMIFEELNKGAAVDSYRRSLQRRFVSQSLDLIKGLGSAQNDGSILLLAELENIYKKASKAKGPDAITKAHWQALAKQIKDALEL